MPTILRPAMLLFVVLPALAQSGEELLARVDHLRHPWPSFTMELSLKAPRTSQRWKVSALENGDARLDGLSEKELGRAVLLKGDQMWLLLPGAKRPVKVTPQQRMMGPAAGGDVARTRFREDYSVETLAEESLDGRACWRLDLTAKRLSVSARHVVLWVTRADSLPVKAEFRLASGKVARTALFGAPVQSHGQAVLSRMVIEEPSGARVELLFANWGKGGVDAADFELPGPDR